jgi:hypothetical protein
MWNEPWLSLGRFRKMVIITHHYWEQSIIVQVMYNEEKVIPSLLAADDLSCYSRTSVTCIR